MERADIQEQAVNDMEQAQLDIEQASVQAGIERYRKTLAEQGEAALTPGQLLLRKAILPMSEAIRNYIDEVKAGRPARGAATVVKYLDQFDVDVVSYITAQRTINAIPMRMTLQNLALTLSRALEDACNHDRLKQENPGLYRQLLRKIEKSSDERYRHVVLLKQMKFAKVETVEWTLKHSFQMGELLVHLFAQSTGLVEIKPVQLGPKNSPFMVLPKPETLEWLEKSHARCELLSPVFMPMVVPPKRWRGPYGGGYLTKGLKFPLVKTGNRNYLEELKAWPMPNVYATINALQETPWGINKAVLGVMRDVWESGGSLGKLPPRDLLPLPAKDFPEDAGRDDPRVKAWRREAAKVYETNARLVSKRVAMIAKLDLAERFEAFPAIYFPHALDWRGRAYAVGSYVHPQADDSGKAMLQFATGQQLGDNGAYWLAVHGANCFGVDKVSYEDRVKWVNENHDKIVESAFNPVNGARWWAEADAPYQFLAFCFEWAGLDMHCQNAGSQATFVSHLPVGLDGSCNGLQNFSAMLRDEVGGKATNLVPSDKPSDIYAEVAAVAGRIVAADAEGLDEVKSARARKWVGKITRKMVKRNTMTVPYAVTEFGMRDQLMQELRKLKDEGQLDVEYNFEDATYLAAVNHEAIGNVVVAARAAMTWLQETAKVAAQDGLPIKWVAPSGLLVVQDYRRMKGDRIESYITGRRVQIMLRIASKELDRRRMASGISPNFVHSLDAAHMVATVNRGMEYGVSAFAMVHDSFGTHAGSVDALALSLRETFVKQYEGDVLGGFRDEVVKQLPEELAKIIPPCPPVGTLDIEAILRSDYFFS